MTAELAIFTKTIHKLHAAASTKENIMHLVNTWASYCLYRRNYDVEFLCHNIKATGAA